MGQPADGLPDVAVNSESARAREYAGQLSRGVRGTRAVLFHAVGGHGERPHTDCPEPDKASSLRGGLIFLMNQSSRLHLLAIFLHNGKVCGWSHGRPSQYLSG